VDGKRGERTIHLVMSVPYFQRWLNEHPGGDGDYLWSKLSSLDQDIKSLMAPPRPFFT
jgi:hypothetical protein